MENNEVPKDWNETREVAEKFTVTERKMQPFKMEDAKQEKNVCVDCSFRGSCPIIDFVNRISKKRDGRMADNDWSCSMFESED
ncbi:MAG: hypothetical protein GQ570_11925 [Helicobacteraceae bacterium]|nr:hypothetical protein [Helicobacteraceae bacterium]